MRAIERAFGQTFSLLDLSSGELSYAAADWLNCDYYSRLSLCEEIGRRGQPDILDECAPLLMLAIPIGSNCDTVELLAISTFLTQSVDELNQVAAAARTFGVDTEQVLRWSRSRAVWNTHALLQLSFALTSNAFQRQQVAALKAQCSEISSHLFHSFDELGLLHRLADRLSLSHSAQDLTELAVEGLAEVVPAECVIARFVDSSIYPKDPSSKSPRGDLVLSKGTCPIPESELAAFVYRLGPAAGTGCMVLNRQMTDSPTWYYPQVREAISVPIRSGDRLIGHLLACNCRCVNFESEPQFTDVDVSLVTSVAAILGIHAGNHILYRDQTDLLASVVRALVSAIDAKDAYTCGHSEQVARISVCIARQLGFSAKELDTVYLGGLLHDIGKIGVSDNILRKPGPLTAVEYEHIKTHPELGNRILAGIKQLDQVLPVVLHHHEAWNGQGYPQGLQENDIPKLARIVAVADAVDAMASDRPYRKGISEERLNQVLREGAGTQWDPQVVEAFFTVRDQIESICRDRQNSLPLQIDSWPPHDAPDELQEAMLRC